MRHPLGAAPEPLSQGRFTHLHDEYLALIADRLDRAIGGRGAFRRFKDTLSAWPDLMTRW